MRADQVHVRLHFAWDFVLDGIHNQSEGGAKPGI